MLFQSLISTTADILKIVLKSSKPSDLVLSQILREKKNIGSKERRFVSESVFTCLRNYTLLQSCILESNLIIEHTNEHNTKLLVLCALAISENEALGWKYDPSELLQLIYPNKNINIKELIFDILSNNLNLTLDDSNNWIESVNIFVNNLTKSQNYYEPEVIEVLYSTPKWILDDIQSTGINPNDFAKSLVNPANVCLRIKDKQSIATVENLLIKKGVEFHYSKYLKNCIILDKRAKIDDSEEYKSGLFEIQDEGSQLIGYSVSPEGRCTILDACAGAGGKSLQLAELNPNIKTIVASDSEYLRIKDFSKRLRRYKHKNIQIKHAKSMNINYLNNLFGGIMFDYILVDAPCTGLGTARRDPLKKFRTTIKIAEKMHQKQFDILSTYSEFVKPGGIIVYATCSVLSFENIKTVERFLKENPDFEPDNLFDVFQKSDIAIEGLEKDSYYLNLYPHKHGTDGFFMARMKRRI